MIAKMIATPWIRLWFITTERFLVPLLWIHLRKSPLLLKSLIDSESSYVIVFSCLVVQYFYIHVFFIFYALLNVYHQDYFVCNLFFLTFFIFHYIYYIHSERKVGSSVDFWDFSLKKMFLRQSWMASQFFVLFKG